jgi:hypothetical protein
MADRDPCVGRGGGVNVMFPNVRVVTGVVHAVRSVRARNASRRRKLNLRIANGWLMYILIRGGRCPRRLCRGYVAI